MAITSKRWTVWLLVFAACIGLAQTVMAQGQVYYSFAAGGAWNDPKTWTFNPSGFLMQPLGGAGVPGEGAEVVILSTTKGVWLEADVAEKNLKVEIAQGGELRLGAHGFTNPLGSLSGVGTLVIGGANIPQVAATGAQFYSDNGGTIRFASEAGDKTYTNLPAEANNVIFSGAHTYTISREAFTMHGNLQVLDGAKLVFGGEQGRSSYTPQTLTVHGNIEVIGTGSTLTVADGDMPAVGLPASEYSYYEEQAHRVYLYGDLSNRGGQVRFAPTDKLDLLNIQPRSKAALFMVGDRDAQIACESPTDLYYLVIDKALGVNNEVKLYASKRENFRLWGPMSGSVRAGGSADDPWQSKALWLRKGVLVLRQATCIASLSEGGSPFIIPLTGALRLDGEDVLVVGRAQSADQVKDIWLLPSGTECVVGAGGAGHVLEVASEVLIDYGVLSMGDGVGPVAYGGQSAIVRVRGGALLTQRIQSAGAGGRISYRQSGGVTVLRGQRSDLYAQSYAVTRNIDRRYGSLGGTGVWSGATFALSNDNDAFVFTGGELRILGGDGQSAKRALFEVKCAPANYSVTGGTLRIDLREDNGTSYSMTSTAPIYDVHIADQVVSGGFGQVKFLSVESDLNVLRDLLVEDVFLRFKGHDVSVGRNFRLEGARSQFDGIRRLRFFGEETGAFYRGSPWSIAVDYLEVAKAEDAGVDASVISSMTATKGVAIEGGKLMLGASKLEAGTKSAYFEQFLLNGRIESSEMPGLTAGGVVIGASNRVEIRGNGEGYIDKLTLAGRGGCALKAYALTIGKELDLDEHIFDIGTNELHLLDGVKIARSGGFITMTSTYGGGGIRKTFGAADTGNSFLFPIRRQNGAEDRSLLLRGGSLKDRGDFTVNYVDEFHPRIVKRVGRSDPFYWRVRAADNKFGGLSIVTTVPKEKNPTNNFWDGVKWNQSSRTDGVHVLQNKCAGDYTRGRGSGGKDTYHYRSKRSGYWFDPDMWESNWGGLSAFPTGHDIATICSGHHVLFCKDSIRDSNPSLPQAGLGVTQLTIEKGGSLNLVGPPTRRGNILQADFGRVSGGGTLMLTSNNRDWSDVFWFPKGDFTEFNREGGTTYFYTRGQYGRLGEAGKDFVLPPREEFGNLILQTSGGHNIVFNGDVEDVRIMGSLVCRGSSSESWIALNPVSTNFGTGSSKRIEIEKDLKVESGVFLLNRTIEGNTSHNADHSIHVRVLGNTKVEANGGLSVTAQEGMNFDENHALIEFGGDLVNNSRSNSVGVLNNPGGVSFDDIKGYVESRAPVRFFGEGKHKVTGDGAYPMRFYTVEIDKGHSQDNELLIDYRSGISQRLEDNWFKIKNGKVRLAFPQPKARELVLSHHRGFTIPVTAGLTLENENLYVRMGEAGTALTRVLLGGSLEVHAGNLEIGKYQMQDVNTDIEYSSGTKARIVVGGDKARLTVYGRVRRNESTQQGVLNYVQRGGEASFANGIKPGYTSTAGFEVEGGRFVMTGGLLKFGAVGGRSPYGDLYLRPSSNEVTGGTILLQCTYYTDVRKIYSSESLFNLTLQTTVGRYPNNNKLFGAPLQLKGNFRLEEGSKFDAQGLDVTIGGDLTCLAGAEYHGVGNTTYLKGREEQKISGTGMLDLKHLVIQSTGDVTVERGGEPIEVKGSLKILNRTTAGEPGGGSLLLGNHLMRVYQDLHNETSYTTSGSGLISLGGQDDTYRNVISGENGSYGSLEIASAAGAQARNSFSMTGKLDLKAGKLYLDQHLLRVMNEGSIVRDNARNTYIVTNGTNDGGGIEREFTTGMEGFLYPLGTREYYTPVQWPAYPAYKGSGMVRVKNVNEQLPGYSDDCKARALKYYWLVSSQGLSKMNGNVLFEVPDALAGNAMLGGSASDYRTYSVDASGQGTERGGVKIGGGAIEGTAIISDASEVSGWYTIAHNDCRPIIPAYISNGSGQWNEDIWLTYPDGLPAYDQLRELGGPNGKIVYIRANDSVSIEQIGARAVALNFIPPLPNEKRGMVALKPSALYTDLGMISGIGSIAVEDMALPAGNYSNFLGCENGGMLIFGGQGDNPLAPLPQYEIPYLWTTGSGKRISPKHDLTICQQLRIGGTTILDNTDGYGIKILGSIERVDGGGFLAGKNANAHVELAGKIRQRIGGNELGNFTGNNAFYRLIVNNPDGVEVAGGGKVAVTGELRLRDGVLYTRYKKSASAPEEEGKLTITTTESNLDSKDVELRGHSRSFVSGPLNVKLYYNQSGGGISQMFPLGYAGDGVRVLGNQFCLRDIVENSEYCIEFMYPNVQKDALRDNLKYADQLRYWRVRGVQGHELKAVVQINSKEISWSREVAPDNSSLYVGQFKEGLVTNPSGSNYGWYKLPSLTTGTPDGRAVYVSTSAKQEMQFSGTDYTLVSADVAPPTLIFSLFNKSCIGVAGENIKLMLQRSPSITVNYPIYFTLYKNGVKFKRYTYANEADFNKGILIKRDELITGVGTGNGVGEFTIGEFMYTDKDNKLVGGGTDVPLILYARPGQAKAHPEGPNKKISSCLESSPYQLNASAVDVGAGSWTVEMGLNGKVEPRTAPNALFYFTQGQHYRLRWTVKNGDLCESSDDLTFQVIRPIEPKINGLKPKFCPGDKLAPYIFTPGYSGKYIWTAEGVTPQSAQTSNNQPVEFTTTEGTRAVIKAKMDVQCDDGVPEAVSIVEPGSVPKGKIQGDTIICGPDEEVPGTYTFAPAAPFTKEDVFSYAWKTIDGDNPPSTSVGNTTEQYTVQWRRVVPTAGPYKGRKYYKTPIKLHLVSKDSCPADIDGDVLVVIQLETGPVYHEPNNATL